MNPECLTWAIVGTNDLESLSGNVDVSPNLVNSDSRPTVVEEGADVHRQLCSDLYVIFEGPSYLSHGVSGHDEGDRVNLVKILALSFAVVAKYKPEGLEAEANACSVGQQYGEGV